MAIAITEIQRIQDPNTPIIEVFIGKRLDQPYHRIHASKITQFRNEPIRIHLAGPMQGIGLEDLRDYVEHAQQVLRTAEQFQQEIDNS